jgi:branched-chain amino acid transport system ATP-binding protein
MKSLRHVLADPLLEVRKIDIYHGDAQTIREVSFHVNRQEIRAILGANGSGKSTVLKAISSVIHLKRGEILFLGKSLLHLKPEGVVVMGISHVPEGRRLFYRLTVLENLELGAYPSNVRPYLRKSLDRVFDLFPVLKDRIGQAAGTLSGGEQQMLAIARALMARPLLLMLDEPSSGLAPIMVSQLFETIHALNEDGLTILLVEQNVHRVLEIVDYVYVLNTGMLKMEGNIENLLNDLDFQETFLAMMR